MRLARPDEMFLYRQAAEANKSPDDKLVHLIELASSCPSDEQPTNSGSIPPQRT
jgi:hypothetical protein